MLFGRPFIQISYFINVKNISKKVQLDPPALMACDIWMFLLKENHGLTFDFILGKLPRQENKWFVDASGLGYGGVCGTSYFKKSHSELFKAKKSPIKSIFPYLITSS